MKRLGMFYRQLVSPADMEDLQDNVEAADRALIADFFGYGIAAGGGAVTQHSPVPDLTVRIAALRGYDQQGRRIQQIAPLAAFDCSVDVNGDATIPVDVNKERIGDIYVSFDRALFDQRIDGNNQAVWYQQDEAAKFELYVGDPAAPGAASPPANPGGNRLLLARITFATGMTQILNANINNAVKQGLPSFTHVHQQPLADIDTATLFVTSNQAALQALIDAGPGLDFDHTAEEIDDAAQFIIDHDAELLDAIAKKHAQNSDVSTNAASFTGNKPLPGGGASAVGSFSLNAHDVGAGDVGAGKPGGQCRFNLGTGLWEVTQSTLAAAAAAERAVIMAEPPNGAAPYAKFPPERAVRLPWRHAGAVGTDAGTYSLLGNVIIGQAAWPGYSPPAGIGAGSAYYLGVDLTGAGAGNLVAVRALFPVHGWLRRVSFLAHGLAGSFQNGSNGRVYVIPPTGPLQEIVNLSGPGPDAEVTFDTGDMADGTTPGLWCPYGTRVLSYFYAWMNSGLHVSPVTIVLTPRFAATI